MLASILTSNSSLWIPNMSFSTLYNLCIICCGYSGLRWCHFDLIKLSLHIRPIHISVFRPKPCLCAIPDVKKGVNELNQAELDNIESRSRWDRAWAWLEKSRANSGLSFAWQCITHLNWTRVFRSCLIRLRRLNSSDGGCVFAEGPLQCMDW